MTTLTVGTTPALMRGLFPGVLACAVVGAASAFLSEHYGAPVMLFALLLGLAMNFLGGEGPCKPGIDFTARACCASASHCSDCASRSARSPRSDGSRWSSSS